MEPKLKALLENLTDAEGSANMDDEEFTYSTQVKFALSVLLDYPWKLREEHAQMVMLTCQISRGIALKRLSEAMEIFPSMEKASKAFERARLNKIIYQFLSLCKAKENTRDAPQYVKLLMDLNGLADLEDIDGTGNKSTIINMLKSSPESLGIPLPDGFDLLKFVENLEGQYERKSKSDQ